MNAGQALVQTYEQEILRLAVSILGDQAEAEEAAQEAFFAALAALEGFRAEAAFKTWLYRITINECLKRQRKRQARERLMRAMQSISRLMGEGLTRPEEITIRRTTRIPCWWRNTRRSKSCLRSCGRCTRRQRRSG
jgi:RNA polymerase sigma factor (sigma-70 family)